MYLDFFKRIIYSIVLLGVCATIAASVMLYFLLVAPRRRQVELLESNHPDAAESAFCRLLYIENLADLAFFKMLLDSAGIPYWVRNEHLQNLGAWSFLPDCTMEIIVPRDFAPEARQIINEALQAR